MGRTSKFTFPLPGRKQKTAAPQPSAPGPLSKAHKTLGTTDLQVDPVALHKDSKQWETRSNSGISICISDDTAESTQGRLDRDAASRDAPSGKGDDRKARWEEESAIIPKDLSAYGTDTVNDITPDGLSLRHRGSTSTIMSYYDKSKLPLSISQQTSASAMARGLPLKANKVLDIDGSQSIPLTHEARRKPGKVDLSNLLSKTRSSRRPVANHDMVDGRSPRSAGHELTARSPSAMSVSPGTSTFSARQPRAKRTMESLRSKRTTESLGEAEAEESRPVDAVDLTRAAGVAPPTNNLHNPYDPYEQHPFQHSPRSELASNSSELGSHPYASPATTSMHYLTGAAAASTLSRVSPADSVTSISSRHTRTSRASKRTDHSSMVEFDLHQNSVLSLSSDSEEDDAPEAHEASVSAQPRPSRDSSSSSTSAHLMGLHRTSLPVPPFGNGTKPTGHGFRVPSTKHPAIAGQGPAGQRPAAPATGQHKVSARTSLSSVASTVTPTPQTRSTSTSRLSLSSTVTSMSSPTGSKMPPGGTSGSGFHEGRAVAAAGPQRPHLHAGYSQKQQPPTRRLSQGSSVSELAAGPLSPATIDVYYQSPRWPVSPDNVSIRSEMSMGTVGSGASVSSPRATSQAGNTSNRFMAVTRQEEMLLAALRMKRARMRENIIAELEDESDDAVEEVLWQHLQEEPQSRRGSQHSLRPPDQPLPELPRNLAPQDRRGSAGRRGSRHSSVSSGRLAPLRETGQEPKKAAGPAELAPNDVRPGAVPAQISTKHDRSSPFHPERPHRKTGDQHAARPNQSPDNSLGSNDDNSDDLPEQARARRQPEASIGSEPRRQNRPPPLTLRTPRPRLRSAEQAKLAAFSVIPRSDTESVSSSSTPNNLHGEDVHVRIVGDAADDVGIPRPDSPISPGAVPFRTPMPRKKQVRLSAVGFVPEIDVGMWGNDG